jgi:tetratricopeptide (TPR) repeat protein
VFGPDHPETAHGLYVLASYYADQGKYEQAELLYNRALTIQERALGPDHRDTVKVHKDYKKLQRKKEGRRRGLFSFFFRKRG